MSTYEHYATAEAVPVISLVNTDVPNATVEPVPLVSVPSIPVNAIVPPPVNAAEAGSDVKVSPVAEVAPTPVAEVAPTPVAEKPVSIEQSIPTPKYVAVQAGMPPPDFIKQAPVLVMEKSGNSPTPPKLSERELQMAADMMKPSVVYKNRRYVCELIDFTNI